MKTKRASQDGRAAARARKHRSRPTPKWLKTSQELDAIARSRCLMVLSVLSGEKPVTDAIREARISRGTYYQMETRALKAMLAALNPLAAARADGSPDLSAARAHIEGLQGQVLRLQQEGRRTQRLLLLTRKAMRSPLTTGRRGRPPSNVLPPGSILSGRVRSWVSKAKTPPSATSIPTRVGENGP